MYQVHDNTKPLTLVSLCAGMGGFESAAQKLGIKVILASEISHYKRLYLEWAYGVKTIGDLTEPREWPFADIYTAGFPCQGITNSNSNGKGLQDSRSGLFFSIVESIRVARPRVVILENSPNLVNRGLWDVLRCLAEIGYDAEWRVLSCKELGLPSKRARFVLVAYSNGFRSAQVHLPAGDACKVLPIQKAKRTGARAGEFSGLPGRAALDEVLACSIRLDHGIPSRHIQEFLHMAGNSISPRLAEYILHKVQTALAA